MIFPGLKDNIQTKEIGEASTDLLFSKFLEHRMEEATRSFVVKIEKEQDWENLFSLCSSYGTVSKLFQYKTGHGFFVLVEMNCKEALEGLLNYSKETDNFFSATSTLVSNEFMFFNDNGFSCTGKPNIENVSLNVPVKAQIKKSLSEARQQSSFSEQVYDLYHLLRLNDLGIRLRFLMCKQVQSILSGLLPGVNVFPFGSSITGFGINGCDLDLVAIQKSSENPISIELNTEIGRHEMQTQLSVLSNVVKYFMKGCKNIQFIKNARVPIVKYKQCFADIDCDLSLYCESGVIMSQILHCLCNIDERVKPLVFFIKVWAKQLEVTCEYPCGRITNFSLSLLVLFFLQQSGVNHPPVLPTLDIFLNENQYSFNIKQVKMAESFVNFFKVKAEVNDKSVENFLKLFFSFFANFNFEEHGVCLKTGKIIENNSGHPLYIRNPLNLSLNVSKNVSLVELNKFKSLLVIASDILNEKETPQSETFAKIFNLKVYKKRIASNKNESLDLVNIFSKSNKNG